MKFKSIFNKRNYKFLYYKIKPFYNDSKPVEYTPAKDTLSDLIKNMVPSNIDKLVLVASGPSSKKLTLKDNHLYFCTNNSVDIVNSKNLIYYIQDYFYTLRYLKQFFNQPNWLGTFCIVDNNNFKVNRDVFNEVSKYLNKNYRCKPEILISDFEKKSIHNKYFEELNFFLKDEFDSKFESLNSGFSLLQIITYFSKMTQLPIEVYGLDFGFGGYEYFDGKKIETHCAFDDKNINKMKKFIDKLYSNKGYNVLNYSNFQPKID